ncbi:MAG: histidine phosphatase family protein [Candidatus Latescibacteria bacterium]|jgi:2,3-bisphosphoglycerate-dependent phosphoglycerate mutase|nr:histidine phosphatase family protein [Candidatus Latescibacterota bacterium]
MNNKINITFMRHGRSRADDENVIEGRYDAPLTDVGRQQVQARAKNLKHRNLAFDAIIASPLKRAAETAQIVGQTLSINVEFDDDWMEKDNGPIAGMSYDEAKKKYPLPDFHNPFDPHVLTANAGETMWTFQSRAAKALEKVIHRGPGQYLVVAHGGILSAAMRCIVGAQPPVTGQGIDFSFGDTGFVRTHYTPNQNHWIIHELVHGSEIQAPE